MKTAFLSTIVLLGISCRFNLEDINPPDVSPPAQENFNIALIANDSSQLVIYKRTNFTFGISNNSKFDFGSQNIIITLNDEPIHDINYTDFGESVGFSIDPRELNDGNYTLQITSESSFSGENLASLTGTKITIFQEWEILVDKTPVPIEITSVEIENGELVIYWDPEIIRNFDRMYLSGESDHFYGSKYVEVDRLANKASFPYFLEGTLNLELRTSTDSDIMSTGPSYEYVLNENLVTFELQDSTVSVDIKKPSLYNHVHSFTVGGQTYDSFNQDILSLELANNLLFGQNDEYVVSFRYGQNGNTYYSFRKKLGLGTDVPLYSTIIYSEIGNCYYASYSGYMDVFGPETQIDRGTVIYRMDENFNVTNTFELNVVDRYGSLVLNDDESQLIAVINETERVYFLNPLNLSEQDNIRLSNAFDYNTYGHRSRYGSKITSNNILYIRGVEHIAIDLDTQTEVFRGSGGMLGQNGDISNDGKFIFNSGNLYEWNGVEYSLKSSIDTEYLAGVFLNDAELLHFNNTDVEIINANTMAVQTFTFDGVEITKDFGAGPNQEAWMRILEEDRKLLSFLNDGKIEVIDFNGVITKSIEISPEQNLASYLNGYLIGGRAIKLTL